MERKSRASHRRVPNDTINIRCFASSFAGDMALRQSVLEHDYPQAANVAMDSFYVDDGLVGADSVEDAIRLHEDLQKLFS